MTILKTELANDPLGRGYAAMTDEERFTSLQLENIPAKGSIATHDIQIYYEFINVLYTIRSHTGDAAKHVTMVFDQFDHFDMSNTNQETVLTANLQSIVTAGVISQAQMDVVIDYGDILVNRLTELGIASTTINDVTRART